MATATKMKSVMLSSKMLRQTMSEKGLTGTYAFVRTVTAIDELNRLRDALEVLHSTPSPNMTKEGRALRYKQQFDKAAAAAERAAMAATEALNDHEAALIRDAEIRAGLHKHVDAATAAEIRSALRSMSQEDRDRAVREAALAGDSTIIQAIRGAPSALLIGAITVPMESLVEQLIQKTAPELGQQRQDIGEAFMYLSGAAGAFGKEANGMRDPQLESAAGAQEAATKAADAAIDAAAAGAPPPAPASVPSDLPAA